MLIFGSLCIIYLNLVVNTEIAQSYMLLTANIEDIKKIAKKFVSDSLAEQISDFIAKAKIDTISKENEMNVNNVQDLSSEVIYQDQNIPINNPENKAVKIKNRQKKEKVSSAQERYHHKQDSEITTRNQWTRLAVAKNKDLHSKHTDFKNQQQSKYFNRERNDKTEQEKELRHKKTEIKKQWYELSPNLEPNTNAPKTMDVTKKHQQNRFKIKSKNVFKTVASDSNENKRNKAENRMAEGKAELEATTRYMGYNIDRASMEKTTERNLHFELDYENEYSKKDLIATSGPVRLKRVKV